MTSRREFLERSIAAGAGTALFGPASLEASSARAAADYPTPLRRSAVRPVAVASSNGLSAVDLAMERLAAGADTLQAVVAGVNLVEADPADYTVGYGGLPNEEGVVQLDASVMHGPTRGAGAVASLEGVRMPSRVAVAVMRYTDHVMLVGEGARRFARQIGFDTDEELLTPYARQRWLEWKSRASGGDDWLTPDESGERIRGFTTELVPPPAPPEPTGMLDSHDGVRPWGTINCDIVAPNGDISGVTTTSGLFAKIPGRIGDSPIVGAGLYVDNDVGAAGSTGRGEAVIKICGSHTIVEAMRRGASPTDACLEALRRIVTWTVEKRLLRPDGRPDFNVSFYALNKRGDFGSASIYPSRFAVNVDGDSGLRDAAYLFENARPG